MTPEDFDFTAKLIHERSGLVLTRDKGYLLENRLMTVVRRHHMRSLVDLVATLRTGDAAFERETVDAMMAKDTAFFRDWLPFVHLRTVVLPNLARTRAKQKSFRILSAGVSTGQEAYSVAIDLRECGMFEGWHIDLVGVDISASAIAQAAAGSYNQFDVQRGLPIRTLLQYFTKEDSIWKLGDDVRGAVALRTWNLLDELFPLGRFDVVLCRNVLIYFDLQTKLSVLQKLARLLPDDGALYLGRHETVTGVSGIFQAIDANAGVYAANRTESAVRSLAVAH